MIFARLIKNELKSSYIPNIEVQILYEIKYYRRLITGDLGTDPGVRTISMKMTLAIFGNQILLRSSCPYLT